MNKKVLMISIISFIAVVLILVILFIFPGVLRNKDDSTEGTKQSLFDKKSEDNVFYDERTEKSFNIVDGKVEVYLPKRLTYRSSVGLNYDIDVEYDDKYRISKYDGCDHSYATSGDEYIISNGTRRYLYRIDNKFDRIYYEGGSSDGSDYSFMYEGKYIIDVENHDDFGVILNEDMKFHTAYNSKGLVTENVPNPFFGVATNEIRYSSTGLISEIKQDDNEKMDYEYAYDDDNQFTEMTASGEMDGRYVNYHNIVNREDGHIINYSHGFVYEFDEGHSDNNTIYNLEYEDDKLIKVYATEDGKKEDDIIYSYDEDGRLHSITGKNRDTRAQEEFVFTYDNDQITEINMNNGELSIKIDYEVGYIDKTDWDDYYNDYYYSLRYEVMKKPIDRTINAHHNDSPFVFEYIEGYLEQTIEHETFYYANGYLYNWAVLPHVINGDFYTK